MVLEGAERQKYIVGLMMEIKNINNGIIQNDLIRILSEKLKVAEQDLLRIMKSKHTNMSTRLDESERVNTNYLFTNQIDKAQIELLQLLVHEDQSVRQYVKEKVQQDLFITPFLKKIAGYLLSDKMTVETSGIIEYFQDKNERDSVTEILFSETKNFPPEEIVLDCLKLLKSRPLKEKIQSLRVQIREKELNGENTQEELEEVVKLRQELNAL